MRRSLTYTSLTVLQALALIIVAASNATAQIGGPKDLKEKETDAAKAPSSFSQKFEKEGIILDFSIKSTPGDNGADRGLVEGADARVSFSVTDKRTGQPITGLHPNSWISARADQRLPNEAECKDKIRTFLGGLLSVRPDIDLNSYLMLTLNHDNTVTFINPQVSFNITKLESIIPLPGAGMDWTASRNKDFVYLTMPDLSAVAVIDTVSRKLVGEIATGDKTRPTRIALQPDGRYVWVGLDGSPVVAVIDTATNKLVATVPVGAGLHSFAFTSDSRFAYVANSEANTVTAIDTKTLKNITDIGFGKTPIPIAYSSASGRIYVASINGGDISVIDPASHQVVKTLPLKRGIVAMKFEPNGRYGFAANQVDSTLIVIDAATNSVVETVAVIKSPDQIAFTDRYVYVRGTGSEKFSLIEISDIAAKGKISPVDIQAGRLPASTIPEEIGVSDMIAPTPEGNAVMIANTPDQMIYYYVEGMMAPMGTFQNYKRRPHALMILDRSLAETAPGVYSAPIKLKEAGRFDVPVMIDQPRIINCFQLEIAQSPEAKKIAAGTSTAVEAMFGGKSFKPGEGVALRFKITDPVTKQPLAGLKDVQVLIFEPPGVWQHRQWAKEISEGVYEISQAFPRAGLYNVMVRIASRGIGFADLPFTAVPVVNQSQASSASDK